MGNPAYDYSSSDYDLPAEEDIAADEAAEQTTRLVVIEGGEGAVADTAAADAVTAGASDAVVAGGTETAVSTGIGATLAGAAAFVLILFWPSDIAPEYPTPPHASTRHKAAPTPNPVPPVTICPTPPPDPCPGLVQDIRDAIDRSKPSKRGGMHGLRKRWQDMIDGPCGPGQFPYLMNWAGKYVRQNVWQNHQDQFNQTKNALRNRFNRAVDAGCGAAIPDDLLDAAADAEKLQPPDPSQWKGDPNRPCVDDPPPPDWGGPWEPPSSRGL